MDQSVDSRSKEIRSWLKSGALIADGVRLFSLWSGAKHPFLKVLQSAPTHCRIILINELCRRVGISQLEQSRLLQSAPTTFRDNWPFLSEPDCPIELKVLASDKITAYYRYIRAHDRLFDCTSREEMFSTVKECVENYIENRAIIAEFLHYRQHGHVLGKHPIFAHMQAMQKLSSLSPLALVQKRKNLEHAIWRTQRLLHKGDKPHLKVEREASIRRKKQELARVQELLKQYA